jgi:hypothetical protein
MLSEVFLRHLNIHLSPVLLETQVGVFFKPPRGYLAFTDAAEYWGWWRVLFYVFTRRFRKLGQITGEDLCS